MKKTNTRMISFCSILLKKKIFFSSLRSLTSLARMKYEIHLDYCTHTEGSSSQRLHHQQTQYFLPPNPNRRTLLARPLNCQPPKVNCFIQILYILHSIIIQLAYSHTYCASFRIKFLTRMISKSYSIRMYYCMCVTLWFKPNERTTKNEEK